MTSDEIKLKNVTSPPELLATVKELASDIEANTAAIDEQLVIEDKDNAVKYKYNYTVENGHLVINLTKADGE